MSRKWTMVKWVLLCAACTQRPQHQPVVTALDIEGNDALDEAEIEEAIATRPTPKFLGLVRGLIYEYQAYDQHVLINDLSRVERLYQARGYYKARVLAGRVLREREGFVQVELSVEEGEVTTVRKIDYEGVSALPPEEADAARAEFESHLDLGEPLDEERLEAARKALAAHLRNSGYARAMVSAHARVDLPRDRAKVLVSIEPGNKVRFGDIRVRGLGPIPEAPIRRAIDIEPGDDYSEEELDAAEQALLELGVFTSVQIEPQISTPTGEQAPVEETAPDTTKDDQTEDDQREETSPSSGVDTDAQEEPADESRKSREQAAETVKPPSQPVPTLPPQATDGAATATKTSDAANLSTETNDAPVPVEVSAQPAQLRTLRLGGGIQLDVIRTDFHLTAGWEHRNFLGGLRKFSVTARPGIVLFPTRVPDFAAPERLLPEVKTTLRLEQPGFLEARTRGFLSAAYDIYPVLLTPNMPDDAPIIGYREFRGTAGVERRFGKLTLSPSQNLQTGVPFTYLGNLAESAAAVYISYLELDATLDFRNDRIRPREGVFLLTSLQFAGVGGDARDFRVEPEARAYVPIRRDKSSIAMRFKVGFLFPLNYQTPDGLNDVQLEEQQIAYFRSFFSGGANSNRGYPFRGVGPHGVVEFFNPAIAAEGNDCNPSSLTFDAARCSVPLGGRSLWEASVAFRFEISGPFSSAVFCDASDVSEHEVTVNFLRPHVSCGLGPRYDTPVGPVRVDVGYRIPGLQLLEATSRNEGPENEILGLPIHVSFGIGEAF